MRFARTAVATGFLLAMSLAVPALAQQGDCDNNGFVNAGDLTYLVSYLFTAGPPPNLVLCDCDGYPGVNYGDLWQLTDALFMGATLYPSPGTDVPIPSTVRFMVLGQPDGVVQTTATIIVDAPVGLDCLVLPYSFAPGGAGEAVLNCTGVSFTGSVGTNLQATIDNVNQVFTISNSAAPSLPTTTNWRLFATASFTATTPGSPVTVRATTTPTLFPMLLSQSSYAGVNMVRVLIPVLVPYGSFNFGDVNCDGQIDIDDIVYMINYIFLGGPPPGDPDNDGIPNC